MFTIQTPEKLYRIDIVKHTFILEIYPFTIFMYPLYMAQRHFPSLASKNYQKSKIKDCILYY